MTLSDLAVSRLRAGERARPQGRGLAAANPVRHAAASTRKGDVRATRRFATHRPVKLSGVSEDDELVSGVRRKEIVAQDWWPLTMSDGITNASKVWLHSSVISVSVTAEIILRLSECETQEQNEQRGLETRFRTDKYFTDQYNDQ